jgi:hypothetical protein
MIEGLKVKGPPKQAGLLLLISSKFIYFEKIELPWVVSSFE